MKIIMIVIVLIWHNLIHTTNFNKQIKKLILQRNFPNTQRYWKLIIITYKQEITHDPVGYVSATNIEEDDDEDENAYSGYRNATFLHMLYAEMNPDWLEPLHPDVDGINYTKSKAVLPTGKNIQEIGTNLSCTLHLTNSLMVKWK